MQGELKLFMILLGCKPKGRHTEQHDIFFGIGAGLKDVKEDMINFWHEAGEKIHIDAWREVNVVDSYEVKIFPKDIVADHQHAGSKLFFLNLGGYKENEFEEYHYKMLIAAPDKGSAIKRGKETVFYKHTGFKGAESHIDDKYGVDVDDLFEIEDVLPQKFKKDYCIRLIENKIKKEDPIQLGYAQFSKI